MIYLLEKRHEFGFGTMTPYYYQDPNYGQLQIIMRGKCKCSALSSNVNKDLIQEIITANANNFMSEAISQNQNVGYEKLSDIVKNHIIQKMGTVLPSDVQFVGMDMFELGLTKESMALVNSKKVTIVDTSAGSKNGQTKCPKCGATEITPIGEGGHGVEKIVVKDHNDKEKLYNELINKGEILVEEAINQSKEASMLNPNVVNSLRVITLYNKGEVYVLSTHIYDQVKTNSKTN